LRRRPAMHAADVEELEDHLRGEIGRLVDSGLSPDEAFLVAVRRLGAQDELANEFAREHSQRLWKQLVAAPGTDARGEGSARREVLVVLALAGLAALAVQVPELFGCPLADDTAPFYVRNASLFVLPLLAAYFAWKRGASPAIW